MKKFGNLINKYFLNSLIRVKKRCKLIFSFLIIIEKKNFNFVYFLFFFGRKVGVKLYNKIILLYYFFFFFLFYLIKFNFYKIFIRIFYKNDIYINIKKYYQLFIYFLQNFCQKYIVKFIYKNFELNCYLKMNNFLINFLSILKYEFLLDFKVLSDIIAVDYLSQLKRFEIVYTLLSLKNSNRVYLRVFLTDLEMINSASTIFNSSLWQEREVWDLFGIFFIGHPDLRRILTDYGFQGHPLKKDFPLSGFVELYYNYSRRKIIYEPVNLAQKYRNFNFEKIWS